MKIWFYLACCILVVGVFSKNVPAKKRDEMVGTADDDDENGDDDQPKRLVVYYNFESITNIKHINDKSGYENSGIMTTGGEILKFSDPDYTCSQGARLYGQEIILKGDTFQAKPKSAITIAAWIRLEVKAGQHSIFDTIGVSHAQGQYHFEVNDGVVRWFHRDDKQHVVFETMAHTIETRKWTHVAGTYDSKTKQAKIFINGEIRNQSIGEGILSRDWGVRAGISNTQKNRPLQGAIDEFRIYNYALKPDEIKALVSACKAGNQIENSPAAAEPNDHIDHLEPHTEHVENEPGTVRSTTEEKSTDDTGGGGKVEDKISNDNKTTSKKKRSLIRTLFY